MEKSNKNTTRIYSPEILEKTRVASSDLKSEKLEESRKIDRVNLNYAYSTSWMLNLKLYMVLNSEI